MACESLTEEFNQVAEYESDVSITTEVVKKLKKNKTKTFKNWLIDSNFDSRDEALEWIREEKCWSIVRTTENNAGTRVEYRCNKVPSRGVQCTSALYLLYNADSMKVTKYVTLEGHNHDQIENEINGINDHTKELILSFYTLCKNITPATVLGSQKIFFFGFLLFVCLISNYLFQKNKIKSLLY